MICKLRPWSFVWRLWHTKRWIIFSVRGCCWVSGWVRGWNDECANLKKLGGVDRAGRRRWVQEGKQPTTTRHRTDSFARVVPHFSKSYWNVVFSLLFEQGLNFRYARLVRTCRGNVFSNNSIDRIGFKRLSIRKIRYSEFCAVKWTEFRLRWVVNLHNSSTETCQVTEKKTTSAIHMSSAFDSICTLQQKTLEITQLQAVNLCSWSWTFFQKRQEFLLH